MQKFTDEGEKTHVRFMYSNPSDLNRVQSDKETRLYIHIYELKKRRDTE